MVLKAHMTARLIVIPAAPVGAQQIQHREHAPAHAVALGINLQHHRQLRRGSLVKILERIFHDHGSNVQMDQFRAVVVFASAGEVLQVRVALEKDFHNGPARS